MKPEIKAPIGIGKTRKTGFLDRTKNGTGNWYSK